jgi:DNA sulfur modification protein DndC
MQRQNPWGNDNKELLTMYRGASADGECPLVVDTNTPSCGKSRFGCWVCTLVEEDKSMAAMIQNDEEKEWMLPLLELRKELEYLSPEARARDRERRDYRRRTGQLSYYTDKDGSFQLVPGPYKQETRAYFLRKLLQTQNTLQKIGPKSVRGIELITLEELQEIRRIWKWGNLIHINYSMTMLFLTHKC